MDGKWLKQKLSILQEVTAGNKITAAALQDTDGSASHTYQFFSKKRCLAACAIDIEKHLLQCPRLSFEKLALAAGSFEK
jgi:hypothetical protein